MAARAEGGIEETFVRKLNEINAVIDFHKCL